jgi:probable F420-dependent oxidoreductase
MRPFRFLADIGDLATAAAVGERARRAEALGYGVLVIPDHVVEGMSAPLVMLAVAAGATERIRLGTFVLNNDLRHPVLLAREAATLDVLSGGRLELGIGAGWNIPEYERTGIAFDPVATRTARLAESLAIVKGALAATAEAPFSFVGTYYRVTGLFGLPKPVQHPHPPIFVGGGGRRTLELAAREANIVGLAPRLLPGVRADPRSITLAATVEKIGWVRSAAGDRFGDFEFNTYPSLTGVSVTDNAHAELREVAARVLARTGIELSEEELAESPHIFVGSVDGLVEKLLMLRERLGITSFMIGDPEPFAPVAARLAGH